MSWLAGVIPAIMSVFGGGQEAKQGSTYSPGQQKLIDQISQLAQGQGGQGANIAANPNYQIGQNYLQSMFNDPEFFNKFEGPIKRQFEEDIVPGLANRFASQGSGGSLGSTGFRNQLAREGSNLSTNLAAQRGQMQMGAIPQLMNYAQQPFNNLMSLYNSALGSQPNNQYFPATAGPLGQIGGSLLGGMSGGIGQYYGNELAKSWNSGSQTQLQPGQNPVTG